MSLKTVIRKITLPKVLGVIFLFGLGFFSSFIFFANKNDWGIMTTVRDIYEYPIKTTTQGLAEQKIKNLVGEEYFEKNFEFIRSYQERMLDYGTVISGMYSYEYSFLPFSGEHEFVIKVTYDSEDDEFWQNIPDCVYLNDSEKCSFQFSYSQAFDAAIKRFETEKNVSVFLIKNGEEFLWQAKKIEGDPLCAPTYVFFTIDTKNGEQSELTEEEAGWCI